MTIKQISIFVENREGRLADITAILAENEIGIRALSVADTTDYGILRLIVSDPDTAVKVLKEAGLTVSATEVLGVGIPDVPGSFAKVVRLLSDHAISVEYVYAFVTPEVGTAYLILRVEDNEAADKILRENGFSLVSQDELYNM